MWIPRFVFFSPLLPLHMGILSYSHEKIPDHEVLWEQKETESNFGVVRQIFILELEHLCFIPIWYLEKLRPRVEVTDALVSRLLTQVFD